MRDEDFDSVTAIAAERNDICICMSSTPTGKRGRFYDACTDPKLGYSEHYHPSTHNPNWCDQMESEFRAQLSEQGYIHEIMAEFGTQETGVFDKIKLDMAMQKEIYAYDELTYIQRKRIENDNLIPYYYDYSKQKHAPYNTFRCMGVDFDKFSAGSSLLVLDYDIKIRQFRVIKRYEVPRGEYSYDNAFNKILEFNEIYNPSWIYCDRGNTGEYLVERLHLYGKEHPSTMLNNKVKGFQFKNVLEIEDPVTRTITKQPMKPFMVTQLQILIERDKLILSPFDEVLHKQLIDYEVEKDGLNGPIFTSKNEHFVDALGLATLAFTLEFPDITQNIKRVDPSTFKMTHTNVKLGEKRYKNLWTETNNSFNPEMQKYIKEKNSESPDNRKDRRKWIKVDQNYRSNNSNSSWGSRSGGSSFGRSIW